MSSMRMRKTTIDNSLLPLEEALKKAQLKAMQLLELRDRSEQELRSKLAEKEFSNEVIDQTIDYLYQHHYLDDMRAASNYIRSRIGSYSNYEIRYKLSQKGFSKDVIDSAFEDITLLEDDLPQESDSAAKQVASKLKGRNRITYAEKQKLMASLYRKGYSRSAVNSAFEGIEIVRSEADAPFEDY